MMASIIAVLLTASLTGIFTLTLIMERHRGVRYFSSVRNVLDVVSIRLGKIFRSRLPRMHKGFFRNIFHYLTHRLLSGGIVVLRKLEGLLTRVAHLNRAKAINAQKREEVSHLHQIARHKQETSLSDEQRAQRREDALDGKS